MNENRRGDRGIHGVEEKSREKEGRQVKKRKDEVRRGGKRRGE